MFIALGCFITATILLFGTIKMFGSELPAGLENIGKIYGSFFLSLSIFFYTISAVQIFDLSPIFIQVANFWSLYAFLFTGVAFMTIFSFALLGKRTIGGMFFVAEILTGAYFLFTHLLVAQGATLLGKPNSLFYYWDPHFSRGSLLIALLITTISGSLYSKFLLQAAFKSPWPIVRKRSLLFSIGSIIGLISGWMYFCAHFFAPEYVPYIIAASNIPGIIGFGLMVLPIFMRDTQKV